MSQSLGQTFLQLLPFLIAGAFLPTWTSYVIILLGTDRPFGNAGGYVAGNATWRLILGFIAIFVTALAAPKARSNQLVMPIWFSLTLAAILLGIGIYLIRKKPKTETQEIPKWLKELKRLPPWASFGYGMWSCMLPGAQWVYFLGGCAVIATSGLNEVEQFGMLLVFIAGLEVMLADADRDLRAPSRACEGDVRQARAVARAACQHVLRTDPLGDRVAVRADRCERREDRLGQPTDASLPRSTDEVSASGCSNSRPIDHALPRYSPTAQ